MEHDLNSRMIFVLKEKYIILTHTDQYCLLLQIYLTHMQCDKLMTLID